jgi:beta-galactosidase
MNIRRMLASPTVRTIAVVSFAGLLPLQAQRQAQAQPQKNGPPPLILGDAWYPEAWPESRWETDLELMQKAGIHVVRVGEGAWSRMEPSEGHYDFEWLQRAVALAGKHGIYTVMGTPTYAPPAWLTQKYPETLVTLEDGKKDEHGNRQQFSVTNPKYREFCRDIATRLAQKFGHNPNVIGWQIGNEYARADFSPASRAMFQDWLHQRYGTLDNLNARWTTTYWSQTYSDWSQIPIETSRGNPGLTLNWKRFVTDVWRSFQQVQIDAIRANSDPRQFITTNRMGWVDVLNDYTIVQDLSMAGIDNYVGQGHFDPVESGSAYDLTRGQLHKNFWVLETQPGFVNWAHISNALDKGEVRAMAWTQVGHGADAVLYWQWRSALNGQEQYHGTVVGQDGKPMLVYSEISQVGAEFAKAGPALAGTLPRSDVALLHSQDSWWAINLNLERLNTSYDPQQEILSYYRPLRKASQSIDIISAECKPEILNQYKLLVAPALNVMTDAEARNLTAYVRQGGHLVLGQRSGFKDVDNAMQTTRQPGPLAELLGGHVEQYFALLAPVPVDGKFGSGTSKLFTELLAVDAPDVEVLQRYGKSNGWLDGLPAVVTRKVGKGRITYVGTWMDDKEMDAAAQWMTSTSGITPAFGPVADGVDVYPRYGKKDDVFILVNLKKEAAVTLPAQMHDVLADKDVTAVTLPQYGVAVLSRQHDR